MNKNNQLVASIMMIIKREERERKREEMNECFDT